MNVCDMRVIKTRESIENALFELLRTRPVSKVTVAELSRVARINKGTFYRHYLDISDLYSKTLLKTLGSPIDNADFFSDFFDAPERFMEKLELAFMSKLAEVQALLQGQSESLIFREIAGKLSGKVYETGRIAQSIENDMKLDVVFGALLSCMPKYYAEHKDEANALTVSLIRLFFPGETN